MTNQIQVKEKNQLFKEKKINSLSALLVKWLQVNDHFKRKKKYGSCQKVQIPKFTFKKYKFQNLRYWLFVILWHEKELLGLILLKKKKRSFCNLVEREDNPLTFFFFKRRGDLFFKRRRSDFWDIINFNMAHLLEKLQKKGCCQLNFKSNSNTLLMNLVIVVGWRNSKSSNDNRYIWPRHF